MNPSVQEENGDFPSQSNPPMKRKYRCSFYENGAEGAAPGNSQHSFYERKQLGLGLWLHWQDFVVLIGALSVSWDGF